jgi:hypothetical protein
VDDNIGLKLFEKGLETLRVGNVALVVLGFRIAVALASKINADSGGCCPLLEGLVDDMMA